MDCEYYFNFSDATKCPACTRDSCQGTGSDKLESIRTFISEWQNNFSVKEELKIFLWFILFFEIFLSEFEFVGHHW